VREARLCSEVMLWGFGAGDSSLSDVSDLPSGGRLGVMCIGIFLSSAENAGYGRNYVRVLLSRVILRQCFRLNTPLSLYSAVYTRIIGSLVYAYKPHYPCCP
jgi:hypothetical protein